MPKKELTHKFVEGLQPTEKPISFYDEIESGLILRLSKAGTKTFTYRYRFYGKNRRYTIGKFPAISLKQARDEVREIKVKVNNGIDPQAEKQARKSRPQPKKFEELAERYKKQHLSTLKQSTQRTYGNRIDSEMIPAFKGMYVKDMTRGIILELLEDIAIERNQPTHSNRVRAILSSIFSFAVQREIAEYNPVKTIKPLGEETQRDRVLEDDEIKSLWNGFQKLQKSIGSALQMLLLLGQRKGETCRMKWEDIELDKPFKRSYKDENGNDVSEAFLVDVWTIPKEQTKANREHEVPLPPLAVEIIEGLRNDSPYVFESNRYKGKPVKWLHDAFKRVAKQAEIEDIKIHDLRRSAATYMAEMGTDRTILGKVLNHKGLSGDSQVTARYDRYSYMDEKQKALNRWSQRLQKIIEGKETNVTKIA